MSLVVVCVIIALAVRLVLHARDGRRTPGWLGPLLHREGRPGDDELRPAAGLVLLLPLLPAADLQVAGLGVLGTVGIPTILLVLLLRAAVHRPCGASGGCSRRPVAIVAAILTVISMGVLTYKGATAKESLGERGRRSACRRLGAAAAASPTTQARRGRGDLRAASAACNCHTYLGTGLLEPRRARPHRRSARRGRGRRLLRALRREPVAVRQQRDAAVRGPRRGEPAAARRLPRRLQGPEVTTCQCASSSASPAPRARRTPRGCCRGARRRRTARSASARPRPGIEVLATELYGDARLPRDEVLARFTERARRRGDRLRPERLRARRTRAARRRSTRYVVCPCSMATVGHDRDRRDGEPDPPRRRRSR